MKPFRLYKPGISCTARPVPATLLALTLLAGTGFASAQNSTPVDSRAVSESAPSAATSASATSSSAPSNVHADGAATLPDAPSAQLKPLKPVQPTQPGIPPLAPLKAKTIPAGWRAQPLTAKDKVLVGAHDLYSIENFGAMFLAAGYEQAFNSQPNYGTDRGAFGERLGAAAIRETSQGIFTDMVFSPLLHEDPRYYQEGDQYSVVHRTLYAITRPLITRKDNGGHTINGSLLLGYAASAALTPSFYPPLNRNFHDTVSTYGGSIGGAALGFFVSEFSGDVFEALHLRHNR